MLLRLFGASYQKSSFARRGFVSASPAVQVRLELITAIFIEGCRAALLKRSTGEPNPLKNALEQIEPELRGFAYEGAAMGLALLDFLAPWRNRWRTFVEGQGRDHVYMMHVGLGWAWARLPVRIPQRLDRLDPLLRWLALDGYGFHHGYFRAPKFIDSMTRPRLTGYALRAFDQGLGRSLWFVRGGDVERVAATVADFPSNRRADLWSGVGLACAYAGGVAREEVEKLGQATDGNLPQLAQGMAFAAKARERAGNMATHTEIACQCVWGVSASEAAAITDHALERQEPDSNETAYEVWRRRVQAAFEGRRSADPPRVPPSANDRAACPSSCPEVFRIGNT